MRINQQNNQDDEQNHRYNNFGVCFYFLPFYHMYYEQNSRLKPMNDKNP